MKNRILNLIFIIAFMCCIVIPALCMNTKSMQISSIDNKLLTEWPGFDPTLSNNEEVSAYVDDRIGFREKAIEAYTVLNDKLFHVMVHPLFMYGKEGQIYYKDPTYIAGYQRMNTDEEYLDTFVDFISETNKYLTDKGIDFIYYLCPDKKTIYPEYFPDSIHVNTENISLIDYMKQELTEKKVDYIIPDEELKKAKESLVVYNKLYDATHWNEDGAFIGHILIDEKLQALYDDVKPLSKDDFDYSTEKETSLDVAKFTIDEDVPHYALKNDTSSDMTTYLYDYLENEDDTFYCHFVNNECGNSKKLLVFTDSYFGNYHKFYQNRFKEVYFVHWHNYKYLQYYVNLFFPDMVIFETAERSILGEMIGTVDENGEKTSNICFEGVCYEPAYKEENSFADEAHTSGVNEAESIKAEITNVSGVAMEDSILKLNVNSGDNIVNITGYLDEDYDNYNVYADIGGEAVVECDYMKLREESIETGLNRFSFNVQRRFLMEEPITLFAVNEENGVRVNLYELEIKYAE